MPNREDEIRQIVRRTVHRMLGIEDEEPRSSGAPHPKRNRPNQSSRPSITAQDVSEAEPGTEIQVPPNALVTPLARQIAMERRVTLTTRPLTASTARPYPDPPDAHPSRVVAIGCDHGGFEMKEDLKAHLVKLGYRPLDCGTDSKESVDYPDFAHAVARQVAEGTASWGIVIDGAGIGSCMAANKVPGVRAAMCYDQATAVNSREHNNANVLSLGAGLIGANLARQIVEVWLKTDFGGGRHARRVNKIMDIERQY